MTKKILIRYMGIFIAVLLCLNLPAMESEVDYVENVKAVFIYHFTKYIQWPQNEDPFFRIAVIGDTPILEPLNEIAEKKKNDHKDIQIIAVNDIRSIDSCRVLYIHGYKEADLPSIIQETDGKHVLIIGDEEGALEAGVMINFRLIDETVKFEINLKAMKSNGFYPSSELLKLAVRVIE